MKVWKIIGVLLTIVVSILSVTACGTANNQPATQIRQVPVVRGDLITKVHSSGKTAVVNDAKLAFSRGGKLAKLNVQEGENVTKGIVLAKLDTDALELSLTEAQVAYYRAQVAVTEAEVSVTRAEAAVTQAEINLENAEIALEQTQETYTSSNIKAAQADLEVKKRNLEDALLTLLRYDPGTPGYEGYQKIVAQAQASVNTAEDTLDAMLSGFSTKEVAAKETQVKYAQQSLELAKQSLELTRQSPELSRQSLELAKQSLQQAQKQLDEATITAPFDGIIATTNAKEGDIIPSPTVSPQVIIYMIDISSMQISLNLDETDVQSVQVNQKAIISIDAVPSTQLEGKVNFVSAIPDPQLVGTGVISYEVKVSFVIPSSLAIKTGMSASVDILTTEHKNVLLLPNDAVKKDNQGKSYVEILNNRQVVTKPVITGLSNSIQTEIVSGLNEGDKVMGGTTAGKWSLQ